MQKNDLKAQRKQSVEQQKQKQAKKSFTSYCEVYQLTIPTDLKQFVRMYSDYCKLHKN